MNCCEKMKLIWDQKSLTVKEDSMNWLIFYCSFVNKMCRDKFTMITLIWVSQFVIEGDEVETQYSIDYSES